jgi:hypothetical protein
MMTSGESGIGTAERAAEKVRKEQIPHASITPTSATTALVGGPDKGVRDDKNKGPIGTTDVVP